MMMRQPSLFSLAHPFYLPSYVSFQAPRTAAACTGFLCSLSVHLFVLPAVIAIRAGSGWYKSYAEAYGIRGLKAPANNLRRAFE